MKRNLLVFVGMLGLAFSGHSSATVIDFNNLAHDGYYTAVNPIHSDGYVISVPGYSSAGLGVWGRNSTYQADVGNAAVFTNYSGSTVTMQREDNSVFDFFSIDLADVYDNGIASSWEFTFNFDGGAQVIEHVTLDTLIGLQTFVFGQTDVLSVKWRTYGAQGFGQFDNINTAGVAPVPLPAAAWLFGTALLGFTGLNRRWRKKSDI